VQDVSANTRPHKLRWSDQELMGLLSCAQYAAIGGCPCLYIE